MLNLVVHTSYLCLKQGPSSLTVGERICGAFVPLITIIEVLKFAVADCFHYRPRIQQPYLCFRDLVQLARETRCNFFVSLINLTVMLNIAENIQVLIFWFFRVSIWWTSNMDNWLSIPWLKWIKG